MIEQATVVGSDPAETLGVAVSEHAPTVTGDTGGQTAQRIKLLLPSGERLDPPLRLLLRGSELRVIGTQAPPLPGLPSIVTCERVNADLPDSIQIVELGDKILNEETGRLEATETVHWAGFAHIASGVPATVQAAGEDAPLDKVTITLPLAATVREGLKVRVVEARTPGIAGDDFTMSGEVLDSTGALRRVIAYRLGR